MTASGTCRTARASIASARPDLPTVSRQTLPSSS
jgi:hypothetical protein